MWQAPTFTLGSGREGARRQGMRKEYKITIGWKSWEASPVHLEIVRVGVDQTGWPERHPLINENCMDLQEALRRVLAIMDGEQIGATSLLPERELAGVLRSLDLA